MPRLRSRPLGLEEIDSDEVVVRIAATPAAEADGPRLADEILAAIAPVTREGSTEQRQVARLHDDDHRNDTGPRPLADPPGHITQEYES